MHECVKRVCAYDGRNTRIIKFLIATPNVKFLRHN